MADLPKDPRQLARDILAGKVSIEDLAREQARRRTGQAPPPARPVEHLPLPRLGQPDPPRVPPIVQRPPVQQRRPTPAPTQRPRPVQRPQVRVTPRAEPVVSQPTRDVPPPSSSLVDVPGEASSIARAGPGTLPVARLLHQPQTLRQAVILSEILSPPLALRDRF